MRQPATTWVVACMLTLTCCCCGAKQVPYQSGVSSHDEDDNDVGEHDGHEGIREPSAADDGVIGNGVCTVITIFGLKTADCAKLNVKVIPRTLESDLQVMRFDDNRLSHLGDAEFAAYANLQEIYMSRNRIELISSNALRGLYSLQIFDVESNKLKSVPAEALRSVRNSLRILNLKDNPIRRVEADSLAGLVHLEEINFENCWLNYVDPSAFVGLTRLTEINLVNNELQSLDSAIEPSLSAATIRVFRLYRNPWVCNCALRWLRRWITTGPKPTRIAAAAAGESAVQSGVSFNAVVVGSDSTVNWDFASNTPRCASPPLVKDVAWKHLTPDHFACPTRIVSLALGGSHHQASALYSAAGDRQGIQGSTWLSSSSGSTGAAADIRAIAGRNTTVECVAIGDPEPTIIWSRIPNARMSASATSYRLHRPPDLKPNDETGGVNEPMIIGRLTLLSVNSFEHPGDYRCTAENAAGRAEVNFHVTVVEPAGGAISSSGRMSPDIAVDSNGSNNDSGSGWSDDDRDALFGVVGGLLFLIAAVVTAVVCRTRFLACIQLQRNRLEQRRRNLNKESSTTTYKLNDFTAHGAPLMKPLNNVTSVNCNGGTVTSSTPVFSNSHSNNCSNRKQYHFNNHVNGRIDQAATLHLTSPYENDEEYEGDDGPDEDDDDDEQYDSPSCEEPLTRRRQVPADGNDNRKYRSHPSNQRCQLEIVREAEIDNDGENDDANDDDDDDDDDDGINDATSERSSKQVTSVNCTKVAQQKPLNNGGDILCDNTGEDCVSVDDDASLSEKLSDAGSNGDRVENGNDFTDASKTTSSSLSFRHGCSSTTGRSTGVRTVSFGPDRVLDDVGESDAEMNSDDDSRNEDDITSDCRISSSGRIEPLRPSISAIPVPAIRFTPPDESINSAPDTSQAALKSTGYNNNRDVAYNNFPVVKPSDVAETSKRSMGRPNGPCTPTISNHVDAVERGRNEARLLPVGKPCVMWPKTEDVRRRPQPSLSTSAPPSILASGRRYSGSGLDILDPISARRQFNGSSHAGQQPYLVNRPRSAVNVPSSACSSLERATTQRRRLPEILTIEADDLYRRPCAASGNFRATLMSQSDGDSSYNRIPTVPSPYSLNNNSTACAAVPPVQASYTLADILSPPFVATGTVHRPLSKLAGVGNHTNRMYGCVDIDDDDSGTAI